MRAAASVLLLPLVAASNTTRKDRVFAAAKTLQDKFYSSIDSLWDCPVANAQLRNASEAEIQAMIRGDKGSWWNCGNTLEALANEIVYTGDTTYSGVLSKTWYTTAVQYPIHKGFSGLDDIQWWALAWARARDATNDDSYLSRSKGIFDETTEYWDGNCGGGVWWDRKKTYKNAITNELFLTLSTRLHLLTKDAKYLDWAKKSWAWFKNSSMINSDGLINDGLSSSCTNNHGTTWTYNQGVILGGLANLYEILKDTSYLDEACKIADAVMKLKTSGGILTESCEPNCNNDGSQFKGIYMRYLGYLVSALPASYKAKRDSYAAFLSANADKIWESDRNGDGSFGPQWKGPPSTVTGISHTSGMDCINADFSASGN